MARLQQRARRQARLQSRAEYQPQIAGARRSLHGEVAALRSEEDPLTEGLDAATAAIKHSNLSARDKAEALKDFAGRQADIPASIVSQIAGARENAQGTISDLQTAQAQQQASILSQLLTAATTHQQEVADQRRQTTEGIGASVKTAELEKALGLGTYDTTQTPEEEAATKKLEVETGQLEHGNGLTPYQQYEHQQKLQENHDTAASIAKNLYEEAKAAGKVAPDPKEWDAETWNHLTTATAVKAKVPIPAAEKAVGAIRDHFETQGTGVFNWADNAAAAAAGAATHGAVTHAGGAHPTASDPSSLLKLLTAAAPPPGRY